jgi:transposase-like protein
MSKTSNKFSPEVHARAVRLVLDHEGEHASRRAATASIAAKIGCSALTDRHKDAILDALGPDKDRTLEEIRAILAQQKIELGTSTLDRFFARHGITRKKDSPRP